MKIVVLGPADDIVTILAARGIWHGIKLDGIKENALLLGSYSIGTQTLRTSYTRGSDC